MCFFYFSYISFNVKLNENSTEVTSLFQNINELHLEVTRRCNLSCGFCYASKNAENAPIMSEDIAIKSSEIILNFTRNKNIVVVFHGGEPLLATENWIDNVCQSIKNIAKSLGKNVMFRMQSNGTLVTPGKIIILKKHDVKIGISIDGPPEINQISRGDSYKAIEGARLLKKEGILGGILVTLNKHNSQNFDLVLDYFGDNSFNIFNFILTRNLGRAVESKWRLSTNEILEARIKIFDLIIKSQNGPIDQNTLQMVKRFLKPQSKRDYLTLACSQPFCHAGIKTIIVDSYSNIYVCGLASNTDRGYLGNLSSIDEDYFKNKLEQFHVKTEKYINECNFCSASVICNFGCAIEGDISIEECVSIKDFYKVLKITPIEVINEGYERAKRILELERPNLT